MQDLVISFAPYVRLSDLMPVEALVFFCNNCDEWSFGDTCHTLVLKKYFIKEVEFLTDRCPPELVPVFNAVLCIIENLGSGVCIDLES